MIKEARWLNVIFRIFIFALFVMTIISLTSGILLISRTINDQGTSQGESLYNAMPFIRGTFALYYYIFILTVVSAVLSVLSGSGTDSVSIFFRTACLAVCGWLQYGGLPLAKIFKTLADIVKGLSYDEMIAISDAELEERFLDRGISAREFDAFFSSDADDSAFLYMILAYLVSMVIFLILAITSVKSLQKQAAASAQSKDMYGETQNRDMFGEAQQSPLEQALRDNDIRGTAQELREDLSDIVHMAPPEFSYSEDASHIRYMDPEDEDF